MDHRYNHHNRRKYKWIRRNIIRFSPNSIGRKGYLGQTDTLLVVSEKCHQQPYKNTLRVRGNWLQIHKAPPAA